MAYGVIGGTGATVFCGNARAAVSTAAPLTPPPLRVYITVALTSPPL